MQIQMNRLLMLHSSTRISTVLSCDVHCSLRWLPPVRWYVDDGALEVGAYDFPNDFMPVSDAHLTRQMAVVSWECLGACE